MVTLRTGCIVGRPNRRRAPRQWPIDTKGKFFLIGAFIVAAASLLAAAPAWGQNNVLIVDEITLTEGESLIGLGAGRSNITADSDVEAGVLTGTPTITFVEVGATGDKITRSTGSWISDGFEALQDVHVIGSDSNNISNALIESVTATELTLASTDLTTENTVGGALTGNPNLTFTEEGATGDKITRAAGSWITDGFNAGMLINVSGSALNNITSARITTVTALDLTLDTTDLVAEGPVNGITVTGTVQVRGVPKFIKSDALLTASCEYMRIHGGQAVPDSPAGDLTELGLPEVADMVVLDAMHTSVHHNEIRNFRGAGIHMAASAGGDQLVMFRADFNCIFRGWTGIELASSDMSAMGNVIAGMRDYGIHCSQGQHRLTDNHCYGMRAGLYLSGVVTAITSVNDMYADSEYGILDAGGATNCRFTNTTLYHNHGAGASISAYGHYFVSPLVTVPRSDATWTDKRGIHFAGGASHQIIGGLTTLDTSQGTLPSTAIRVESDNTVIKDHYIYDLDQVAGSKGVEIRTQIQGGTFEYYIYGFEGSGDAALDIDVNTITGCTITIIGNSVRSPGFNHTDVGQYINIPAGWDVSGANANVIYIKDEATGQTTTVNDGLAH